MTLKELCQLRRLLRDVGERSGRFDWTVQVAYPPPLTESRERRRAQEKAIRLTMRFQKKNIAEAKQRSTPILGLDLNSGLGLKGLNEQVEEPCVGILQERAESIRTRDGKPAEKYRQHLDYNDVP